MTVVATGSVALNEFKQLGQFPILPLVTTSITFVGDADADLYLRFSAPPTLDLWDRRPYVPGNFEFIAFYNDLSFEYYYLAIFGYEATPYVITQLPFPDLILPVIDYASRIAFHFRQVSIPFYPDILQRNFEPFVVQRINQLVASCDSAFDELSLSGGTLSVEKIDATNQNIVTTTDRNGVITTTTYGDRTVTKSQRPSYQQRMTAYHKEVEKLAIALGINV